MSSYVRCGLVLLAIVGLLLLPPLPAARAQINPPTPVSPADGIETTGNPNDPNTGRVYYPPLGVPTFVWSEVDGATKYRLEVSTSETFEPFIVQKEVVYTSYTPTHDDTRDVGFVGETTFFWRVRAWDADLGVWSDPSTTRSFIRHWGYTPQIVGPEDAATLDLTPTFEWEPIMGARQYRLEVSTEEGFPTGSVTTYLTRMNSYTPDKALANDKNYWWRVRAEDQDGNPGPWSAAYRFHLRWGYGENGVKLLAPLQIETQAVNMGHPGLQLDPGAGRCRVPYMRQHQQCTRRPALRDESGEGVAEQFHLQRRR